MVWTQEQRRAGSEARRGEHRRVPAAVIRGSQSFCVVRCDESLVPMRCVPSQRLHDFTARSSARPPGLSQLGRCVLPVVPQPKWASTAHIEETGGVSERADGRNPRQRGCIE